VVPGYLGKYFSGGQAISYALVYAPIDRTFADDSPVYLSQVTLKLYGNSTAPANTHDGTLLGSASFDPSFLGQVVQIFSSDTATAWNYLWIEFSSSTTANSIFLCEQIQFYTTTSFAGTGVTAQIVGPPMQYTSAITTWRLGLFSPAYPYPANGTYHEGRLWLSGAVSNRLDASAFTDLTGNPATSLFYFTPTLQDGTLSAACAINATLDGPDVNAINWLMPDQQGIIIGTEAGEWLVQASALNSPLSALNMQAHRVTRIGCANIEPRRTEHTTVFVQKFKHKIMEYFADIFSGKFSAPNLSMSAKHLYTRGIEEISYQQELVPVIWTRCTDKSLLGASYKRDSLMSSQGPTFIGSHRHTLGSGRVVESLSVGPSAANATTPAGLLDTLALVTNDPVSNVRNVEFLTNLFEEGSAGASAWFVDGGIQPSVTQNVSAGMQLVGLWPYNGKTVTVFAGGIDCGDWLVTNGQANVPYGQDPAGLFTAAFVAAYVGTMPVIAGFTYTSQGQILRTDEQQEAGTRSGPAMGRMRRIGEFAAALVSTQGISFGTTFALDATGKSKLNLANFKTPGGVAYQANALYSGVYWNTLNDTNSRDGRMLCWQITRPYPATVAAISGVVKTEG
jgi:hypothetical protein